MSTAKVLFNTDAKVKRRAQKRAASEGVTLTAMLNSVMHAYADERLSVEPFLIPNKKTVRLLREFDKEMADGRHETWPRFTDAQDLIVHLEQAVRKGKSLRRKA